MATSKIPFNVHSGAANYVTTATPTANINSLGSFVRYTANGFVCGRFNITLSSSATGTWTGLHLITGLPKATYPTFCGIVKVDASTETAHVSVDEYGDMVLQVRGTSLAGNTITGYFMYPSTEAYDV